MIEFLAWKEKLEETTNTCYVKTQQTYCHPKLESMHFALIALVPVYQYHFSTITAIKERLFYVCCRSGKYKENIKPRTSSKQRIYQKDSRKINGTCLSRMYVDNFEDGHVEVEYISAHTGHTLEIKYLPLPFSTKEEVATKLSLGVNSTRILNGKITYIMLCHSGISLHT